MNPSRENIYRQYEAARHEVEEPFHGGHKEAYERFIAQRESTLGLEFAQTVWQEIERLSELSIRRRVDQFDTNSFLLGDDYGMFRSHIEEQEFVPVEVVNSMLGLLEVFYHDTVEAMNGSQIIADDPKGISFELGHRDQFGDWSVARQLDDTADILHDVEKAAASGFVIDEIYQSSSEKTRYSFHDRTLYNHDDPHDPTPDIECTVGVRKRPYVDLHFIKNGRRDPFTIKVFRRSEFMILPYFLDTDHAFRGQGLSRLLRVAASLDRSQEEEYFGNNTDGAPSRKAGEIINTAIQRKVRDRQSAVYPLGSVYVATIATEKLVA